MADERAGAEAAASNRRGRATTIAVTCMALFGQSSEVRGEVLVAEERLSAPA